MMKYIGALAMVAAYAPAAEAATTVIKYATMSERLGGYLSGTLTFDPATAIATNPRVEPYVSIVTYTSPTFRHDYNLFGEVGSAEFSVDVYTFGTNSGQIFFSSPLDDSLVRIGLFLYYYDNAPFGADQFPADLGSPYYVFAGFTGATSDYDYVTYSITTSAAVPEPATWAMMIGGFGMIGGVMRRRSTRARVALS